MSELDAAPPNTLTGGKNDTLRAKGNDPMNAPADVDVEVGYTDERINMEEYERSVPLWKRIWQNSITQMMLLSVKALFIPDMADAIAGWCSDTNERMPVSITC